MSLIIGQATVPSNATVQVFILPPGTVNTTMFQPSGLQSVYIGTSPNVSSVNGLQLTATPINIESYVTSRGSPIYATTGNGTASSFQYLISGGG